MSQRKSERLVNLLIALLSTRRFLTKAELRDIIEDYRGTSEAAFARQFERDKDELRGLGITIETGSNDPFSDEDDGYRINRTDFELPPLTFTPAELAALGLAGQVWQDTVAADHTAQAFEALRAGGAAPDPALVPTVAPRVEVREPDFDTVYDAVLNRQAITFGYRGEQRRLEPWRVLQRRGRWYVFGYDPERRADRFFKLSRFSSPAAPTGKPGAFEVPEDADERSRRLEPSFEASAVIALRDGTSHTWRDAQPVEWDGDLPAGYTAHRVSVPGDGAVIDDAVAAGPDAIVLEPDDLRARVIDRLTEAAR